MAMTNLERQRLFRARKAGFEDYESYQDARAAEKAARISNEAYYKKLREQNEERRLRGPQAENDGIGLWDPSKHTNGTPITTLQGEKENVILWAKLLKVEIPKVGETVSLEEMCRRIYEAFKAKKFAMWNPFSKRFSPNWYVEPEGKAFSTSWEVIEGSGTWPVRGEDFLEPESKQEIEREVEEAAASVKRLEEKVTSNPIAIFQSEIIEN